MIKKLVLKTTILMAVIFFFLTFNWSDKSIDPYKIFDYIGVERVQSLEDLKSYPTKDGQSIIEVNGLLMANYDEYRFEDNLNKYKTIDRIPKNLINAIVAIEDKRFYSHQGFDYIGILRAFVVNLLNKDYSQGGSTITQQLAKNMFLSQEKKLNRKIEEILIAYQLEKEFIKEEVLEMYLNQIYFGPGIYGVEAAAQSFWHKSVSELTLAEAAILAGVPRNPGYYSPVKNFAAAKKRQETVLNAMEKQGYITKSEKEQALQEELAIEVDTKE